MSGKRILADTSVLVDYAKGVAAVAPAIEGFEVQISINVQIPYG